MKIIEVAEEVSNLLSWIRVKQMDAPEDVRESIDKLEVYLATFQDEEVI